MAGAFMVLGSETSSILSIEALFAVLAVKSGSNEILRPSSHSTKVWWYFRYSGHGGTRTQQRLRSQRRSPSQRSPCALPLSYVAESVIRSLGIASGMAKKLLLC